MGPSGPTVGGAVKPGLRPDDRLRALLRGDRRRPGRARLVAL